MPKLYLHNKSNYKMMSSFAQTLIPLNCVEMLPNSIVRGRTEAMIRLSSPLRPFMHPLKVKVFHFFVPTRILWPNWEKFITQGAYGSTPPVHPTITFDMSEDPNSEATYEGSLFDNIGLVPESGASSAITNLEVSAFPFAAYNAIVRQFFQDQDLEASVLRPYELSDGDNTTAFAGNLDHYLVNWKKDYFTAARPWAQKSPAVPIPQSDIVRVNNAPTSKLYNAGTNTLSGAENPLRADSGSNLLSADASANLSMDVSDSLEMDESATMRDLSLAGALQNFFENRAQYGSRLVEYLRGAFGSRIKDSVLQNPQLVNYAEQTIKVSEVLQTAEGTDPVGTLRGHGIGGLGSNRFKYKIQEHGWWMTLAYIMPEPAYMQSTERHWWKRSFTDYFQKEFEAVGQQEIWAPEINQLGATSINQQWGFADRYDEYRRALNQVSGTFRGTDKNWHMFRDFTASLPTLNRAFTGGAVTQRIFASTSTPNYIWMTYNDLLVKNIVKPVVKNKIF